MMDQYISGVIKDISFHELFMKSLRQQNTKNSLFDLQLAYYMLDSLGDTIVNGYEIQGFLNKHGYQYQEYICDQVVKCKDKSLLGLNFQMFCDIIVQGNQQEKLLACYRNNKPKLSSSDYEYWDKVKAQTLSTVLNILSKQAQFYRELQERKRIFCKNWSGDIYKALTVFQQKDQLSYDDIYLLLKSQGKLFNKDEWKCLIERTTKCKQNQYPTLIKKQELVDCLVTSRLNPKKPEEPKKYTTNIPQTKSYTKWLDQQYVLARKHRLKQPQVIPLKDHTPISQLTYKYFYPEAQFHSVGNLYLLQQTNRCKVQDRLQKLRKENGQPENLHHEFRNHYYPGFDLNKNPFARNKY